MIRDDVRVEVASWERDLADLRAVREAVFIVEQNVPPEEEWDDHDARALHVIARDAAGTPIGTGRLVAPGRMPGEAAAIIGRMAVLAAWRGRGVGAAIVRVLLEQARRSGYAQVELHAQTHAEGFYEKLGFAPFGDIYPECGIPHRSMRIVLPSRIAPDAAPPGPAVDAVVLVADGRDSARDAIRRILAETCHEVAILTRDLDPDLLDVPDALDAIKRIALSGRRSRVRILVQEPRKAVADGHRLLALAQRLPSSIELRVPTEDVDLQYPSAFVVGDRGGFLFRPLGSRPDGEGSTHAPGRHAQLLDLFGRMWERSAPSEDLRVLGL